MSAIQKKREERHLALLAIAQGLLIENGLSGLSIERLAKEAGHSRPTVYGHFRSKQVVLEELAQQNIEVTRGLMDKAASFEGTNREKAFGLILAYELLARFHTMEFHVTECLGMPWVRRHLPEGIAREFAAMVTTFSNRVRAEVDAAAEARHLSPPAGLTVGSIVFHSLSMTYGVYTSIVKDRIVLSLSQPVDPWAEARSSLNCYWDGLGWAPSSREVDYAEVAERFMRDLFPEAWLKLKMEEVKREAGMDGGTRGQDSKYQEGQADDT